MKTYIGIDNGISGAVVFNTGGVLRKAFVMPSQRVGTHNELDVLEWSSRMFGAVKELGLKDYLLVLEAPRGSKLNFSALPVMHGVFHAIRAWAVIYGMPLRRIVSQKWQDDLLGSKRPKGMTKEMAITKAREFWPKHDWSDPGRPNSHALHPGIVDAALISEYARLAKW